MYIKKGELFLKRRQSVQNTPVMSQIRIQKQLLYLAGHPIEKKRIFRNANGYN